MYTHINKYINIYADIIYMYTHWSNNALNHFFLKHLFVNADEV